MSIATVANVLGLLAGVGAIATLVWLASRGDPERDSEERARDYFDSHGHWPDEP